MEDSVWTYYQIRNPGEVQVLGADLFNGTSAQLTQFKSQTRATYPLLLCGSCGTGNENLYVPYGDRDNYAIINKKGIVRYNAIDLWGYGQRFHLNEIRATVDSLVSEVTAVDGEPMPRKFLLEAAPNPFRTSTSVELSNPTDSPLPARVSVLDLAGRRVATLWDGPAPGGVTRFSWDGRGDGGPLPPGVYVVRARVGSVTLQRRLVRLR